MELKQLKHFLATLETGSLTAAAEQVGLTQQALSRSLARLEEQIGGKLFQREARGMVVTRLGETIADHARPIVAEARRLHDAAKAELGLERGRLIIGLSPVAATTWAGAKVMHFALKHPKLRIDIETGTDKDFTTSLHRGEVDFAISGQLGGSVDSILLDQLLVEQWGVVGCAKNEVLAEAKNLSDLAGQRWIFGRNTQHLDASIAETFIDNGMAAPRPRIVTTQGLAVLNALRGSDYLAIMPQSMCAADESLRWRDLSDGHWKAPLFLMRRRRSLTDNVLKALLGELGITV